MALSSKDWETFYSASFVSATLQPVRSTPSEQGSREVDALAAVLKTESHQCFSVRWLKGVNRLKISSNHFIHNDLKAYVKELLECGNLEQIRKIIVEYCRDVLITNFIGLVQYPAFQDAFSRGQYYSLDTTTEELLTDLASLQSMSRNRSDLGKVMRVRKLLKFEHGARVIAETRQWAYSKIWYVYRSNSRQSVRYLSGWSETLEGLYEGRYYEELENCKKHTTLNLRRKSNFDRDNLWVALHAEMKEVEDIVGRGDRSQIYIGLSKGCCFMCYKVIQFLNSKGYNIKVRGSSGKHYVNWMFPSLPAALQHELVAQFHDHFQASMDEAVKERAAEGFRTLDHEANHCFRSTADVDALSHAPVSTILPIVSSGSSTPRSSTAEMNKSFVFGSFDKP